MQKKKTFCFVKQSTYKFAALLSSLILCLSLTACGPSEEKVMQAQEKYSQLAQKHNTVVDAHNQVSGASLDDSLIALQDKVAIIETYNLQEMKDEDIDLLIQTMDALIASYDEHLTALTEMKAQEDAAVLTTIPVTLFNKTDFSFTGLSLFEQGNRALDTNVIDSQTPFSPSQIITGLMIMRDVENTPWMLCLTDAEGNSHELVLAVGDYQPEGISLYLTYDADAAQMIVSTENGETTPAEAASTEPASTEAAPAESASPEKENT